MARPRRLTTAETMARVPPGFEDHAVQPQGAPLAAVSSEPAPTQPDRTPARQRLADAIETVRALEAEIVEANAAIEPAREAQTAAFVALEEAERVLADAKPREGGFVPGPKSYDTTRGAFWGSATDNEEAAERARAEAAAPPISIADAKATVVTAQDEYDSARRLVQWHGDRLKSVEQSLSYKRSDITDAVRAVLLSDPALLALATESRRLTTRAAAARAAFSHATGGDMIQPGSPFYGWDAIADARTSDEAYADWSVSRAWRVALEDLKSDPDAVLPS